MPSHSSCTSAPGFRDVTLQWAIPLRVWVNGRTGEVVRSRPTTLDGTCASETPTAAVSTIAQPRTGPMGTGFSHDLDGNLNRPSGQDHRVGPARSHHERQGQRDERDHQRLHWLTLIPSKNECLSVLVAVPAQEYLSWSTFLRAALPERPQPDPAPASFKVPAAGAPSSFGLGYPKVR